MIKYLSIGDPLSEGASQVIITLALMTEVTGGSGRAGTKATSNSNSSEYSDYPNSFLDLTLNLYDLPLIKPESTKLSP